MSSHSIFFSRATPSTFKSRLLWINILDRARDRCKVFRLTQIVYMSNKSGRNMIMLDTKTSDALQKLRWFIHSMGCVCAAYSRSTLKIFMLHFISYRLYGHHFVMDSPWWNAVMIKEATWASWTNTLNWRVHATKSRDWCEILSSTPNGMRGTK